MPQDGPREPQQGPRRAPRRPKSAQVRPKSAPRGPQEAIRRAPGGDGPRDRWPPRWPQYGLQGPQGETQGSPRKAPRESKEAPKASEIAPRELRHYPKRPPRELKNALIKATRPGIVSAWAGGDARSLENLKTARPRGDLGNVFFHRLESCAVQTGRGRCTALPTLRNEARLVL